MCIMEKNGPLLLMVKTKIVIEKDTWMVQRIKWAKRNMIPNRQMGQGRKGPRRNGSNQKWAKRKLGQAKFGLAVRIIHNTGSFSRFFAAKKTFSPVKTFSPWKHFPLYYCHLLFLGGPKAF
jgi:hypothetical protein